MSEDPPGSVDEARRDERVARVRNGGLVLLGLAVFLPLELVVTLAVAGAGVLCMSRWRAGM